MKEWKKPEVSELDVRETASGSDPDTAEKNGYMSGGWHNATYDSVNMEKCDVGDTYDVIPKKTVTSES